MKRSKKRASPRARPDPLNYNTIPALSAYIDRVGAVQVNFRRYIIREEGKKYHYDKITIRIDASGIVELCGAPNKEHLPTDDEQATIIEAFKSANFPKSILATQDSAEALRKRLEVKPDYWFVMLDSNRDRVIMAQQRVDKDDGGKYFVPWTHFSDGEWRRMEPDGKPDADGEPDGLLPLWKPSKKTYLPKIMVHEGAKAAQFCHELTTNPKMREALSMHPWGQYLKWYEHWGWIGGATNPHRTDWSEVRVPTDNGGLVKPDEVVLVCDNDDEGRRAATPIAKKMMGHNIWVVMFDEQFPGSFDLADPFPETLYKTDKKTKKRVYKGPQFDDVIRSAVWATEMLPRPLGEDGKPIKGRPAFKLRAAFLKEWAFAIVPPVFVNRRRRRRRYTEREFNTMVRPFSDIDDVARLMYKVFECQTDALTYQPGKEAFIVTQDQKRMINTWLPTNIKPIKGGDPAPFLEFTKLLFPVKLDRDNALKWCATLIARPDVRMTWGILQIQPNQGVGKSTLMEKIMMPLIGRHNCSTPNESELSPGQPFNHWQGYKRLVIIHEIYQGKVKKVYDMLKSVMTDKTVRIIEKNEKPHEIDNWAHVMAASNDRRPLYMARSDRRWHTPEVTCDLQPHQYWKDFNIWLFDDGLGIIHQWAIDYVEEHGIVEDGEHAPMSDAKLRLIEDSQSDGMKLCRELGNAIMEREDPIYIADRTVRQWVADQRGIPVGHPSMESIGTIREVLLDCGLTEISEKKIRDPKTKKRIAHQRFANIVMSPTPEHDTNLNYIIGM